MIFTAEPHRWPGYSHPPDRPDQGGRFRIGFDLAPQTADLIVDGAIEGLGRAALCEIEQLVARKNLVGMGNKSKQQVVFPGRKRHRNTFGIDKAALAGLQDPVRKGIALKFGSTLAHDASAHAAQDHADAGHQLARVEGLGDIVIRPHLEADDSLGIFGAGCQKDDGDIAVGTNMAAQAQAVLARHHDVQNDEVDCIGRELRTRICASVSLGDPKAVFLQVTCQRLADSKLIIDNKNMRVRFCHDPP